MVVGGTNKKNGTATYCGDIIFNCANYSGKLESRLNNLQGFFITETTVISKQQTSGDDEMIRFHCY